MTTQQLVPNLWISLKTRVIENRRLVEAILLIGIMAASFIIRYIGLKFSYPLLTHTDEPISLNPILNMGINRTLDGGFPYRPDMFLIYVNFVILNAISWIKFGDFFSNTFLNNQLYFYIAARLIIASIGSLLPLIAWKIGKNSKVDFSIPAALVFGFFPSFVIHSHFITPDVAITFLTLLVILFCTNYIKTGSRKFLHLATFAAALNTTEKYPGLISFSLVVLAIFITELSTGNVGRAVQIKNIIKKALISLLMFVLFMYLIAPTLFVEYGRTIDAITNEARSNHLGADNLGWGGNLLFYAAEYLKQGNWILVLFLALGIFSAIRSREKMSLLWLYGFLYWVVLSKLPLHWERWALPMYTAPLLIAAYGATSLITRKPKFLGFEKPIRVALLGVAVAGLFIYSLSYSIQLTYQDTRYAALLYSEMNGITESNSLYEGYTQFSPMLGPGALTYEKLMASPEIKTIILSSTMYSRFYNEADRYPQQVATYELIRSEYQLIQEFKPSNRWPLGILEQLDSIAYYVKRYLGVEVPVRLTGPVVQIYQK